MDPAISLSELAEGLSLADSNPFFSVPLEVRQEIFFWTLLGQSGLGAICVEWSVYSEVLLNPARRDQPVEQYRAIPFWGSKDMASIFPVCGQWYKEIQDVFYRSFTFVICEELLSLTPSSRHGLEFLPSQAFASIRHIRLSTNSDSLQKAENRGILMRGYQEIASVLPNLKSVEIVVYRGGMEIKEFIPKENEDAFVGCILALVALSQHVSHLELDYWPDRDDRSEDDPRGIPFEVLARKCQKLTGLSSWRFCSE